MGYVNSTPSQALRVAGGWVGALGALLVVATVRGLGSASDRSGALGALAFCGCGTLAFAIGTALWRHGSLANHRYFSEHTGSEILGERRRLESRLGRARNAAIIVTVVFGAAFIVLGSTLVCVDNVCTGAFPAHESALSLARAGAATAAALALMLASLVRIHALETDRWEVLSSDAMRRRDDGPTPGLRTSRWD